MGVGKQLAKQPYKNIFIFWLWVIDMSHSFVLVSQKIKVETCLLLQKIIRMKRESDNHLLPHPMQTGEIFNYANLAFFAFGHCGSSECEYTRLPFPL